MIYAPPPLARNSWVHLARSEGLSEIQINDLTTFSSFSYCFSQLLLFGGDDDDDGEISLKAGLVVTKPLVVVHCSDNAPTHSYLPYYFSSAFLKCISLAYFSSVFLVAHRSDNAPTRSCTTPAVRPV